MSQTTHDTAFPSVMRDKLRSVRWRQATMSAARAVAIGAAVLIAAMLVAMIVDWCVTIFDTRIRIFLTTTSLSLSIVALFATGIRPVIAAFGWTRAAGNVDERIPVLQERWRTVASFAESRHQSANATARAMLQQVTSEAVAMSTLVKPKNVVRSVSVMRPALTLAVVSFAMAGFMLINLPQTFVLLQRFWSPTLNISATQLECVTGDIVVPRGETVEIITRMNGLHRDSATMAMVAETASNFPETAELKPVADKPGTLSVVVDVDESFRYRVQAGDGRTEWYSITAIDYPVLSDVRVTVTPPEYVDEPVTEKTLIPGRIRAIQGSQFELAMKSEQDLKSMTLVLTLPAPEKNNDETTTGERGIDQPARDLNNVAAKTIQRTLTLIRGDDGWYHFESQLNEGFSFSPMLTSPHGLTNENPRTCRIDVIEDKAPVARIISPNSETSVSPDETIEIKFEAHDDHGIATAELVIYDTEAKDGEEPKILAVRQIPLGDQQMQKHVMGKTTLDLKELGLEEGQSISYAVRVTDNRMLEMNPETALNRLIASAEAKPDADADDRNTAEAGSETGEDRNSDAGKENALVKADKIEKSSALTSATKNADGKPNESDPDVEGTNDDAKTETLIATADRQDQLEDPYAKMIKDGQSRTDASKDPASKEGDESLASNSESNTSDPNFQQTIGEHGDKSSTAKDDKKVSTKDRVLPQDATAASTNGKTPAIESEPQDGRTPEGNPKEAVAPNNSNAPKDGDASRNSDDRKNDGENTDSDGGKKYDDSGQPVVPNDGDAEPMKSGVPKEPADPASEETAVAKSDVDVSENGNANADRPEATGEKTKMADTQADKQGTKSQPAHAPNAGDENPKSQISDLKSQNSNPSNSNRDPANKNNSAIAKSTPSGEPTSKLVMRGQRSDAGQQKETDRQKLRISARLAARAERDEKQKQLDNPVRERVVQIEKMLEIIEMKLSALYKHQVDESLRGDGFRELDARLGDVEVFISEIQFDTRESAFEFVGLQMVEISGTHVTPARDAVFVAIRKPDSGADVHAEEALHHIVSARELLLALLRKYDSVAQEQELAKKIDEAIKMYNVYVEGSQQLLREAQQNFDPLKLQRQMAVLEVDQAYLDRLAEVTKMRRDMMSELARILGDDPRLRSRYLDLIKRRRASLRSQLGELAARQEQVAQEVQGWLIVSENQRENYWLQLADLRMDLPQSLAKEAQQLSDRIEKQMPLAINPAHGTAARAIELSKQIALDARRCDFDVREIRKLGGEANDDKNLGTSAGDLVFRIGELSATLDQLNFENGSTEAVADYVQLRIVEYRALADQADTWAESAAAIERKQYSGLAHLDQEQITIATELLRMDMLGIEDDLAGEFDEENPMPQEIINMTQELLRVMESITFNQSTATFGFSRDRIEPAAAQQELALKRFDEAGKILDQLRRKTIESLDSQEVQDPNIDNLRDPTLDEFLASLEREPNIEAQLGIPRRPTNIRILQDSMTWSQNGSRLLGASGEAAMARIQQQMKQQLNASGESGGKEEQQKKEVREMSEEEKKQLAESKDMQEMLKAQMTQTMKEMKERAEDSAQSAEQRRQMKEMAEKMAKALEEMKDEQNPEQMWRRMVEADQAKAVMEALAKGEKIPDEQWNRLMSTLDDGLGQVGGRTPPEDYRKAIEQYQDRIRTLTGTIGGG